MFIPDISGFTKFVNATEISHSQHIIAELLELIIDSNQLDLIVSEIEGDAVLFYRFREVPSLADVLKQVERTFLEFHRHLKLYEGYRVCDCGACTTAWMLTLKMVVHVGDITLINVKNQSKLYGPDVITVHRLLKNNVPENEYLLFSNRYFDALNGRELPAELSWAEVKEGTAKYDDIGDVSYKYVVLTPLLQKVADEGVPKTGKWAAPIATSDIFINRGLDHIYEIVTRLELRSRWAKGAETTGYEKGKPNQVGTKHICVINSKHLKFETVANSVTEKRRVYGERVLNAPLIKEGVTFWVMEAEGDGTRLKLEYHIIPIPVVGGLFKPLIRAKLKKTVTATLNQIKDFSENEFNPERDLN